jgi:hypothetical protein
MLSPFSPYAAIRGITVQAAPIVQHNLWFYETDSDFWLVYDNAALRYSVSDASGVTRSSWYYNPGYAVEALARLTEAEADGLVAA